MAVQFKQAVVVESHGGREGTLPPDGRKWLINTVVTYNPNPVNQCRQNPLGLVRTQQQVEAHPGKWYGLLMVGGPSELNVEADRTTKPMIGLNAVPPRRWISSPRSLCRFQYGAIAATAI